MAGLNNLHSLLQKEASQKDFVLVQMEQMINRDVRENTLVTLESMEPMDQYALEGGKVDDIDKMDDADVDDDVEECGGKGCESFDDTSLESELESITQMMEESAGPEPAPPIGHPSGIDPSIEALLDGIPEATEEECTSFFNATENDENLDHNPALEAEMVVIDMLTA